jgi:hypothetical protein
MIQPDDLKDEDSCLQALVRLNHERAQRYTVFAEPQQGPIPTHIMPGIARYLAEGIVPGEFLTAMFTNDLRGVMQHADEQNMENLPAIWSFLYNNIPSSAWGSRERMAKWVEERRSFTVKQVTNA